MKPGRRDCTCPLGDTYRHTVTITATVGGPGINVTGRAYRAHVRADPKTTTAPEATFTVDMTGALTGIVVLTLTAAQTTALGAGAFYWDLEETAAGDVTTILAGRFLVEQDTSH